MSEPTPGALVPRPHAWSDFGLAPAQAARLFSAAAAFYRAAPWTYVAESSALRAQVDDEKSWDVYVFGSAGAEIGISLVVPEETALDEWLNEWSYDAEPLRDGYVSTHDVLFGLTFTPIDDLSPHIRQELTDAGWEVADPGAYPVIGFGGKAPLGVRRHEVDTLIMMLEAIPRFVSARKDAAADEPTAWTDPATGLVIDDAPLETMALVGLWEPPLDLETCQPEGPGARPGTRIRLESEQHAAALENELLEQFTAHLQRDRASPALSRAAIPRQVSLVRPFVEFLVHRGIPPEAITERDLRDFLYLWFPRNNQDVSVAEGILSALRRFFMFLAAADGVRCPWAAPILADRRAFLKRIATRPSDETEMSRWSRELHVDLEVRLLVPIGVPEDGITFGEYIGPVQNTLIDELLRVWLVWRDEVIRSGKTAHESVVPEVLERQRIWEHTPNPLVGGETPARAVAREQEEIRERSRRDKA